MTYIPDLNQVQIGQEATLLTPVTPDILPAGLENVRITPRSEVVQVPSMAGSTMPKASYIKRRWSEVQIEGLLDYNRAPVWFDGMFTEDGSSPHTYKADEDAVMTPKGLTLVFGQTGLIFQVPGVVPRTLRITGGSGEAWKYSYDAFGGAVSDGASLESLTEDTPELVLLSDTSLYMEEGLGATIGSTLRNVMFSFEAVMTRNLEPVWLAGSQTWTKVRQGLWGGSLKLVIEADATSLDSLGDILDATDEGKGFTIRLQATDGTNTQKLDFCGVAVDAPELITDEDGVVSIELLLTPQWNSVYDSCWGAETTLA